MRVPKAEKYAGEVRKGRSLEPFLGGGSQVFRLVEIVWRNLGEMRTRSEVQAAKGAECHTVSVPLGCARRARSQFPGSVCAEDQGSVAAAVDLG